MMFRTSSDAVYEIDLEEKTLVRRANGTPLNGYVAHDLRRDGQPIKILKMSPVRLGAPVAFLLEPLAENVSATLRETTPVVEIIR